MTYRQRTPRGEAPAYAAPSLEMLEIRVEQGFAQSGVNRNGVLDYSPEGDASLSGEGDNDLGTL